MGLLEESSKLNIKFARFLYFWRCYFSQSKKIKIRLDKAWIRTTENSGTFLIYSQLLKIGNDDLD